MSIDDWFQHVGGRPFPFPEIAGTYSGRCAVIADGRSVWRDVERAGFRSDKGRGGIVGADFLTVNKIGEVFPGHIVHWYSNNARLLTHMVAARREEYEFGPVEHLHSCNAPVQHRWPWHGHGTSGLCGILTALALGYDEIIVCGMGLDDNGHNGEPPWRKSNFTNEVCDTVGGGIDHTWRDAIRYAFDGKVTFMSGRPKEWIDGLFPTR